jgi:hypothetical protein
MLGRKLRTRAIGGRLISVRKGWLLSLLVAFVVTSAAAAAVPKTQTCKPKSLPLTFLLPSDWSCEGPPPYGNVQPDASAGGMGPGFVVHLDIYKTRISQDGPISAYASRLASAIQQEFARFPGVRVTHGGATVGTGTPAVLIKVSSGASLVRLDYFFVHAGYIYEFEYSGEPTWVQKDMDAIKASARSIHFVTTA